MTIPYQIDLTPLLQPETTGGPAGRAPLPFLGAVKVTVDVRAGRLESTVAELLALREGEVLTLDRAVDQPLDVLLDGHVVARGTLVAVGDNFGLRLTETPAMSASREPA
jgi:flagellar motor switch protein FliN/FliY